MPSTPEICKSLLPFARAHVITRKGFLAFSFSCCLGEGIDSVLCSLRGKEEIFMDFINPDEIVCASLLGCVLNDLRTLIIFFLVCYLLLLLLEHLLLIFCHQLVFFCTFREFYN